MYNDVNHGGMCFEHLELYVKLFFEPSFLISSPCFPFWHLACWQGICWTLQQSAGVILKRTATDDQSQQIKVGSNGTLRAICLIWI